MGNPPKFAPKARVHRSSCRGVVKDKNFYGRCFKGAVLRCQGDKQQSGSGQGNGSSVKISEVINNGWLSR